MAYDGNKALELLRIGTGNPRAVFRSGQEDAIQHVVQNRGRLLLVQRAGWGKSFVYFIATKLLREQGAGPALLISPLLALIRNQVDAARRIGVEAETIHSGNTGSWDAVRTKIQDDDVDVLMISPERLDNPRFSADYLDPIADRISLLVIDEAHCISDWGHDFRPDYLRISRLLRSMPNNISVLATTATVNDRVMADLQREFSPNLRIIRGNFGLPNVSFQTIRIQDRIERMAWLADVIPGLKGTGIIYTLTVTDAKTVAKWLQSVGIKAVPYYGNQTDRPELERRLLGNEVKCLVATSALGMGYDKPDLGFVIHYQMPASVITYYQQVGRAGRSIDSAYGVLLSGNEDGEINRYFRSHAFPTREETDAVLEALRDVPTGLSTLQLETRVNVSESRIKQLTTLMSLEVPAPIVRSGGQWVLTATELSPAFWERVERLTAVRCAEEQQMREYAALDSGHMEFLANTMNSEKPVLPTVPLPKLPFRPKQKTIIAVTEHLRRSPVWVKPRREWPEGAYTSNMRIDDDRLARPGKALCFYSDPGWGSRVRREKRDGWFSDELVEASAIVIRDWTPDPFPEWVTCIPSLNNVELIPDFASRLATALDLRFKTVFSKASGLADQKSMNNDQFRVRNAWRSLQLAEEELESVPVLLVDDIVHSRWTLTVAAWLLRDNKCGPVWPFALAQRGGVS